MHKYFYATSCPGPYLEKKFRYIEEEVNKRLAGGWIYELDQWHYYEAGEIVKSAWRKDKTGWCYLNKEGSIVKSAWVKSKNKWYYCGSDGYMVTNKWQKDGTGQWCYLGSDGAQVKDKWIIYRSNIYYIKPDGYMATGEREIKCTFDESGKLRK
jgi:glucan-binding YG repeat protein